MRKRNLGKLEQYDYIDDEFIGETSPDYIEAIGLFVLEFSALEHEINLRIADQINDRAHFQGYQVIELLSSKDKIDLFSRWVGAYMVMGNSKKKTRFNRLVQKLRELNAFRNKVLHANWMSAAKDGTVRTRIVINEGEGAVRFERTKITPTLINKKSEECSRARDELDEIMEGAYNS